MSKLVHYTTEYPPCHGSQTLWYAELNLFRFSLATFVVHKTKSRGVSAGRDVDNESPKTFLARIQELVRVVC